jgi:hypothetical protein
MKKEMLRKYLPALILASLLAGGCSATTGENQQTGANKEMTAPAKDKAAAADVKPEAKAEASKNVYTGKVVGKSNKAKQVSIEQDNGTTVMLAFGDNTTGLEHAVEGQIAIVAYEMRDGKPFALDIKPKLAKVPEGTSLIDVDELKALMDKGADFLLVDSRPGVRYSESHLPGAISIPVCEMQELLQNLPTDKNKLLIFYCGGPT